MESEHTSCEDIKKVKKILVGEDGSNGLNGNYKMLSKAVENHLGSTKFWRGILVSTIFLLIGYILIAVYQAGIITAKTDQLQNSVSRLESKFDSLLYRGVK